MNKAMEKVNELILNELENDRIPWEKPWKMIGGLYYQNYITREPYHGVNPLSCHIHSMRLENPSPFYASFLQIKNLGGTVKKNNHGVPVVYFNYIEDKKDPEKLIPFLKYSTVFNLSQTDIDYKDDIKDSLEGMVNPVKNYHALINGYEDGPKININKSNRAFYRWDDDIVNVPDFKQFNTERGFYSVLAHELIHSTGAEKRLNRSLNMNSIESYAKEELIAEIGGAYVNHYYDLPLTIENSASYIDFWKGRISEHKNILVSAFSKAEKAGDYIIEHLINDSPVQKKEQDRRRLIMAMHH